MSVERRRAAFAGVTACGDRKSEEKGIAAQVLTDTGVNLDAARAETLRR